MHLFFYYYYCADVVGGCVDKILKSLSCLEAYCLDIEDQMTLSAIIYRLF